MQKMIKECNMRLQGKTIGYFVAQEVEDLEFWVPLMRLREERAKVIVLGLSTQKVRGHNGLDMMLNIPGAMLKSHPGLDALVLPLIYIQIETTPTLASRTCNRSTTSEVKPGEYNPSAITAAPRALSYPSTSNSLYGKR